MSFKPHLSILPQAQQDLWPYLRPAAEMGYVLDGGTAIALRLGHRVSVDFDFFRETPLDREELYGRLDFLTGATVIQDQPDGLTVLTGGEGATVKVSFFAPVRFGRVAAPEHTDDAITQVASLDDLMATKLKVILQRAEAKDYRDIAAMLKADVSLAHGLAAARAMFGPSFQPSESLKALTYFGEGDLSELSADVKALLISAASSYVRDLPEVAIRSHKLSA